MEKRNYPMARPFCGAKTRHGHSCHQPAMKNGRCLWHGGKSKSGIEHGRYVHGLYTREAIEQRRQIASLIQSTKDLLNRIKSP